MDKSLYESKALRTVLLKAYCRAFFCSEGCLTFWESGETSEFVRAIFVRREVPNNCVRCGCALDENDKQGYGHNVKGEHRTYTEGLKDFFRAGINRVGYEGWTRLYDDNKTGIFPHYNDKKKGKNVANNSSIFDQAKEMVTNDMIEGKKRLLAKQVTRGIRDVAVVAISRSDAEMAAKARAFLDTEVGEAFVAVTASLLLQQLPDRYKSTEVNEIIREIRVGTVTDKVDGLMEMVMQPLRTAGLQLLLAKQESAQLPEPAAHEQLEEPKKPVVETKTDNAAPTRVQTTAAKKKRPKAVKVEARIVDKT